MPLVAGIRGDTLFISLELNKVSPELLHEAIRTHGIHIPTLRAALVKWVRTEIGPIATPDAIQFTPALPKTRSGKIMRRILRKIAEGDVSSLGDTSTLADPAVVDDLIANRVA